MEMKEDNNNNNNKATTFVLAQRSVLEPLNQTSLRSLSQVPAEIFKDMPKCHTHCSRAGCQGLLKLKF